MERLGVQKDDTLITFEKTTEDHLKVLSVSLDHVDMTEILAGTGNGIYESLTEAASISKECLTVMSSEGVVGVFGLATCLTDKQVGFPWGFFTNTLRDLPFVLLKHSKQMIEDWNDTFPTLRVYVLNNNTRSIYFLEWLGFQSTDHQFAGQYNTVFLEYERCAIHI